MESTLQLKTKTASESAIKGLHPNHENEVLQLNTDSKSRLQTYRLSESLAKSRLCLPDVLESKNQLFWNRLPVTNTDQNATLSSLCLQNQACARKHQCPVCQEPLVLGLLDAPVALPCPFTNGHKAPCSFLLGANDGPSFLREGHDTELHVGVSNSDGLVYNYTLSGVQRDEHEWEQCICIQLVPPWRDSLIESWDKELQLFSSLPIWAPERFHEEREFGSCCYGFALTFINHMRSLDSKDSLSRDEFTTSHVLPRMKRASMYIKVYEEIQRYGFYIVDK